MINRRALLQATGTAALTGVSPGARGETAPSDTVDKEARAAKLIAAQTRPVLHRDLLTDPILIDSMDVLHKDGQFFVRVRSTESVTGIVLTNPAIMNSVFAIFLNRVAPFFEGKDARDLDALIHGAFVNKSNYKWQGLAMWTCIAWAEFAILDMIGKTAALPLSSLLGGRLRDNINIYNANGNRTKSAEEVVDTLERTLERSGAKAIKYKVGARMAYTDQSMTRDREIIPLARKRLGDDITLFVDSNSSYDVPTALEIGAMLEEYDYSFFEEPVRFDYLEETRDVADALTIPVAGGEQESSLRRFRWLLENDAVQIAQPDLVYFGGLIRSIRIARMADVVGAPVVPHMSGGGLGILYVLHFAAVTSNAFEVQEYKGDEKKVPYEITDGGGRLQTTTGRLPTPNGPGLGVAFDPAYVAAAQPVKL